VMRTRRPLLILIGGPPWVGKTTCAGHVFNSLQNSAWLDGDDVWRVNPFSVNDPRIRTGDKNMSFVLNTYLQAEFDYVIFSSVLPTNKTITDKILGDIEADDYDIIFFLLHTSLHVISERSVMRDGVSTTDSWFIEQAKKREAIHIDTTNRSPEEIADVILKIVQDPEAAGLESVSNGNIREWKPRKNSK
jgi:hypothetical protein